MCKARAIQVGRVALAVMLWCSAAPLCAALPRLHVPDDAKGSGLTV